MEERCAVWQKAGNNIKVENVTIKEISKTEIQVSFNFDLPSVNSKVKITYSIFGDGSVLVNNSFIPGNNQLPEMPRFGMTMNLKNEFENVSYYGRGPYENYWDRKTASFVGIYNSTVSDMFEFYETPQENSNRTDNRWVLFNNNDNKGIAFVGLPTFDFSASYYTPENLTLSTRGDKHLYEIKKNDFINVNIDFKQMGVGGDDSWGARTHNEYTLWPKEYSNKFMIIPFTDKKDFENSL
jgi:beta-galactosidase